MTVRARGFIEAWHPRAETWELLLRIRHVPDEYVEQLPLTLRQIFYILVDRHAYFLDAVTESARLLRLDRQAGQTRRLALWCEPSRMVPQLQRIADSLGIGLTSSGGFDS